MKLVLFSFALLCGILLIHAQEEQKKNQVDPSAASTLPPQNKSPTERDGKDAKAADSPAPGSKTESDPTKIEPSSTDSPHPTSPPAPKPTTPPPSPAPYPGGYASWNVTATNVTCVMVSGIIKLTTSLKNYDGLNETREIALGPKTPANGSCSDYHIRWYLDSLNSTLQFQFSVNASTKEVGLSRVDGSVTFPQSKPKEDVHVGFKNETLHAFEVPLNKSYYCGKTVTLVIDQDPQKKITVQLDDFKIQAGKFTKTGKFDESIDGCPSHSGGGPDVIPIIVGCMLAVLVVVVLVAYLINRRRSQAHGYLSM